MLRILDLTLPAPQENLALEERLLAEADLATAAAAVSEVIRFWEAERPCVVVGRRGNIALEVDEGACKAAGIPILRRVTGGGAVLLAPGCLNYALVLSLERRPELRDVRASYATILGAVAGALAVDDLSIRGRSDLALGNRKVGGSSQKRARAALLHHGTIMCSMDLALMAKVLRTPPRPPEWRAGRSHLDFTGNLPLAVAEAKKRLATGLLRSFSNGAG